MNKFLLTGEPAETFWDKFQRVGDVFDNPVTNLIARILFAVLILVVGSIIVKKFVRNVESGKAFPKMNKTVRLFLKHVLAVLLYAVIAVVVVSTLGFDLSALSAAVASIGLTIGLALQGGLSNIAGGLMLVAFKPFEIGDYVESSGVAGTVTDIGLFYTTLTTPDNKKVVVPNGTISNNVITNYSAHDTRRIDFDFSIARSASIDTARKVLYAVAKSDERIMQDPKPEVMIAGQDKGSITIRLRIWVASSNYWDVFFQTNEQVKKNFDEFGIEIPFEQLDVHVKND